MKKLLKVHILQKTLFSISIIHKSEILDVKALCGLFYGFGGLSSLLYGVGLSSPLHGVGLSVSGCDLKRARASDQASAVWTGTPDWHP